MTSSTHQPSHNTPALKGAGLGFRREMLTTLKEQSLGDIDFFELSPENWLGLGGRYARDLRHFTEHFNFVCHGLSLSIGATAELDTQLLRNIKAFMKHHNITLYTEHLSWCADDGHLYDLLPIPCTEEAVHWVSQRIQQAQDILEMPIGIENASYYFSPPGAQMREEEFISAVVAESNCMLHLDVNNVYVNSQNFGYNAKDYISALPLERVCYLHVAGHYVEPDGFIVDTHGADVIDPVWELLEYTYSQLNNPAFIPTCLERDFNFPEFSQLHREVNTIKKLQNAAQSQFRQKIAAGKNL
ncbi:DUF692 domain-containing protein [Marinagarivorans cellulosilyticus]|uniref:Uncharacterized protein n=1 Tax=Marinagarivorans cellulosilyticus TaxID=2721545 RepID=A0AAN2BJ61_9GAMM|nr:DUF692 domain-containing protein [Marinagarivorans cellulosilyticus]BCD96604.1 hypothetical protein MARGE09_P0804 [Marinagarivorans cellulosilyticus]